MAAISKMMAQLARTDSELFAAMVLRDESNGQPITLAPHHQAMHRLWNGYDRTVIPGFIGSGKSQQLCAFLAWKIGNNPELRIQVVHNALAGAEKDVEVIMKIIQTTAYQTIFPKVRPGEPWSKSSGFSVANRPFAAKEANATPAALGQGGSLGGRFDIIALDDPDDIETTRSPEGREGAWSAFCNVHFGRLEPNGKLIAIGNAWHQDDLLHRLKRSPDTESLTIAVEDADGKPTWPERWPRERIEQRRRDLGARAFARMLLSRPVNDAALSFSAAAIQRAQDRGTNDMNYRGLPEGRIVVGVDPAFGGSTSTGDYTGIAVICDQGGHRFILESLRGHWSFDNICALIVSKAQYYKASVSIESNGGGKFIHEAVKKKCPAHAYPTTLDSKTARHDWLAAELDADRWTFRRSQKGQFLDDDALALARDLTLTSMEDHTPDRVSALLLALQHLRTSVAGKAGMFTLPTNRGGLVGLRRR